MATEEFKILTETLLTDFIEFRKKAKEQGIETLTVNFKDYLDFYIKYIENESDIDESFFDEDDQEDDEDLEQSAED